MIHQLLSLSTGLSHSQLLMEVIFSFFRLKSLKLLKLCRINDQRNSWFNTSPTFWSRNTVSIFRHRKTDITSQILLRNPYINPIDKYLYNVHRKSIILNPEENNRTYCTMTSLTPYFLLKFTFLKYVKSNQFAAFY